MYPTKSAITRFSLYRRQIGCVFGLLLVILFHIVIALPAWAQEKAVGDIKKEAQDISAFPSSDPRVTKETKILAGFVLTIIVKDERLLSRTYVVDSKGEIHFEVADVSGEHIEKWSVPVASKTSEEARELVTSSMKAFFRMPEVHLIITGVPHLRVEIFGEAARTGIIDLPLKSKLSDALSSCLTLSTADLTNILIRRADKKATASGSVISIRVNFTESDPNKDDEDPPLETGDKIYLQKRIELPLPIELQFARIDGEINRKEGAQIPVGPKMTIKDAIERAGGLNDAADRSKIYLARIDGKHFLLDAAKIEANDPKHNLPLLAGDLILVGRRDKSLAYAILGEVGVPATIEMKAGERIKILDALDRAGGLTKKADKHRGNLVKGYLINPVLARALPFDPEKVRKGEQPNMEIDPGDAIFIEPRKKRPTIWQQLLPFALHFLPIPF